MAKSAKNFSNEENGTNMVDTPRLSTTEDENAVLLHSREPCDDGRSTRATGRLPRFQLIILALSLSNAISIAAVLILVVFHGPAFYLPESPATVIYPAQPEWFPPQSTLTPYPISSAWATMKMTRNKCGRPDKVDNVLFDN
ncbi:hypothetical protein HER10_EVM0005402 [Colletotrichum scovillei]|uniref:uncharacterized protein n=1 Tax=Colletotrichum scovillei TaxID=1209932 RepID=UPI0015C35376|nr:uncharacterized protein HER10_EVM0005402 [Colletotrichum scovillei]KAF4781936.1 hypothetical protein HER10_EVM0005402 [Colletotrichum scovillei]